LAVSRFDDEGGPRVEPDQCIQLVKVDLDYSRRSHPAADGVDNDVDAAERCDRLGGQPLHVQIVGDVGTDGHGVALSARTAWTVDSAALVVQVIDDDRVVSGRQQANGRPANAADPPVTIATRPAGGPLSAVIMTRAWAASCRLEPA